MASVTLLSRNNCRGIFACLPRRSAGRAISCTILLAAAVYCSGCATYLVSERNPKRTSVYATADRLVVHSGPEADFLIARLSLADPIPDGIPRLKEGLQTIVLSTGDTLALEQVATPASQRASIPWQWISFEGQWKLRKASSGDSLWQISDAFEANEVDAVLERENVPVLIVYRSGVPLVFELQQVGLHAGALIWDVVTFPAQAVLMMTIGPGGPGG